MRLVPGEQRVGAVAPAALKLGDALKTSLNELRMQMLGVNVLSGFEFRGLFQDTFPSPEAWDAIFASLPRGPSAAP